MITVIAILGTLVAVVTAMLVNDLRDHNRPRCLIWICGILGTVLSMLFWTVCLTWEYDKWRLAYFWPQVPLPF
jgi:high-affinity Fe2+/Pb2+ permease